LSPLPAASQRRQPEKFETPVEKGGTDERMLIEEIPKCLTKVGHMA
jgi:hypothetical protein